MLHLVIKPFQAEQGRRSTVESAANLAATTVVLTEKYCGSVHILQVQVLAQRCRPESAMNATGGR